MLVVPVKPTVPPLATKVPAALRIKLPPTFIVVAGAVSVDDALTWILLKVLADEPEIVVVPPKVTVDDPLEYVPLFAKSPFNWILPPCVKVFEIVTAPNTGALPPLKVVVPANMNVLDASEEVALLTKFPSRVTVFEPAANVPPERVRTPFTVTDELSVTTSLPWIVRFCKASTPVGNSGPVVTVLELVYTTL
jgi:hypothetical protein